MRIPLATALAEELPTVDLAVLSAIANFLFIPYHPSWSLLLIALDVFVIWALAVHGGKVAT